MQASPLEAQSQHQNGLEDRRSSTSTSASVQSATQNQTLICTIATADTVRGQCQEVAQASTAGASAVEVRLDFCRDLDLDHPAAQLQSLIDACRQQQLVSVLTCRPSWEG